MKKLIIFIILLPFRLIIWGVVGLILIRLLIQWGILSEEPDHWAQRRERLYTVCLQQSQHDTFFTTEAERKRYCLKRTITSPVDLPY